MILLAMSFCFSMMNFYFVFFFFFLMIRRPPRSTLFLHDALPISSTVQNSRPWLARYSHSSSPVTPAGEEEWEDRKSTRLNSSHVSISYAVFCLKKKNSQTSKVIRHHPQGYQKQDRKSTISAIALR